jgi:hypothetical protein
MMRAMRRDTKERTGTMGEPTIPTEILLTAGQACVDWVRDTRTCHLCHYTDHDGDGGERHDDECPLRPLDPTAGLGDEETEK